MKIRKNEQDLKESDIEKYPVWEFAYDENDEKIMFKPSNDKPPYDIAFKRYLVGAEYTLANGTKKEGYIKPINTTNTQYSHVSPIDLSAAIFTEYGQILFWFGIFKPDRIKLDLYYSWLGLSPSEIFPIQVKSTVKIFNGIGDDLIDGFRYCDEKMVNDFFHLQLSETLLIF
jgi:hypothetical protein